MDAGMIARLRRGQAEERDRRLSAVLIERGILTSEEAHELRRRCEPGDFGGSLVRSGRIGAPQLDQALREAGLREVMETVTARAVPDEVRDASQNTLARIGKYILVEVLGRGGMGEVWKAWDGHLGRWVALKRVRGQEPEEIKRFLREANLSSQLSHPGIVRVYEVGTDPRIPYLALEFIDGGSLEGTKRERRRAAEIVRDAARAVHYAHERGVIHRDLKPANLLEAKDGRILVTDFGLARPLAAGATMTMGGMVLGTPQYMAPEQALARLADRRTDVYGLGATLYALVDGKPPFTGKDGYDIIHKVLQFPAPSLALWDDLAAICKKSMERDRDDRYRTAAELADDLDRYLRGEPIHARPVGTFTRVARRIRRHPFLSGAVALLVLATAAGAWLAVRLSAAAAHRERQRRADAELDQARRDLVNLRMMYKGDEIDERDKEQAIRRIESRVETALSHFQDYPPALTMRAQALLVRGRHPEAEAAFTRALELDPGNPEARSGRGFVRIFQLSTMPIRYTMDGESFRAEFRALQGRDLELLRRAEADFESLPTGHPDREYGRALLAFCRGGAAREGLERVLRDDPSLLDARHLLALSKLLEGDAPGAEKDAVRAIRLGLRNAGAFETLAMARAVQGKYEDAARDAAVSLRFREVAVLRSHRAGWLTLLGRHEEAEKEYDLLATAFPDYPEYRRNRAVSRIALSRHDEGLADARAARDLGPVEPESRWVLAMACRDVGHHRIRERMFEAALALFREGEQEFTAFLLLRPGRAAAHKERGHLRMLLEKWTEAIADLEQAARLDPGLRDESRRLIDACRKHLPD